ncbi:MAG TPA: molybdopterin-dependent oxidoreductase, partial [Dehalococcoidia bacterium]
DGEPMQSGVRAVVPGDDLAGRSIAGVVSIKLKGFESTRGAPRESASFALRGRIDRPRDFRAQDLRALPSQTLTTAETRRRSGAAMPGREFTGVLLYSLLEDAGIQRDPNVNEDFLRRIVVAHGADGYVSVIAGGELDPRFMNGAALISPEDDGSMRLVVPFDRGAVRGVKALAAIEVLDG